MNLVVPRLPLAAGALALAGALLLALAVLSAADPAHAGSAYRYDQPSDVWRLQVGSDRERLSYAATRPNADLRGLELRHTRTRVALRADYHALEPGRGGIRLKARFRDPDGRVSTVLLTAGGRQEVGARLERADGTQRACAGVHRSVDYRDDVVRVSVPRRCLDDPASVRVQVVAAAVARVDDRLTVYVDDGRGSGPRPEGWSQPVHRS